MPKKYFAQILLEVELKSETYAQAQRDAREEAEYIKDIFAGPLEINIINTHIIQSPSDEEFLESLCIK